ncbi:hypothetical protein MMYC01_203388 [Madurella mycetomatis]|uniref:Uncharacterized protein n=1 Tax=Madurella mycetomatis TaxID=100816 RepID=A0A175WAD7_9PEZI|nr:hypothetical protein MMYC01_203388 [Madurella mycetomatis]
MKAFTYAALVLGLFSAALAQEDPGPSPTESVGCVPHDDHWDCEGPRVTTSVADAVTTTASGTDVVTTDVPALTTSAAGDGDDHDHEGDEDHTDAPGTGSPGPSPTESFGCEPHGDHWHCEGHVTETLSGSDSGSSPSSTPTGDAGAVTTSTETGGAPRHEATGMALAGLVAVAAMAL